ncbi:serine/threonine protein kinase, CMGC group [Ceratobasidium sp. 370]|nr:serine/threonine protein kinase, CMGC group [Ceratobasidium sp. 370]
MDSDPSVPYRCVAVVAVVPAGPHTAPSSERISPGGTRTVVYTIPDPPKPHKPSKPKTAQVQQHQLDMLVEREESPTEYQPGGYLRVRIADRFVQRYRIARKLGWGHFSTVWLAHDADTDTHVALKIVKSAPRYAQTAADEIALLQHVIDCGVSDPSAAQHPGRDRLVTFLDAFRHTNPRSGQIHSCIAFEPLGMNLLQLIQLPEHKHRGIPVQLCKQIARQTLHGLDYLHRICKLIHTDLKPENIMLRIAPSAVESHIRAELASSPPAIERSVALGGKSHSHRGFASDREARHRNSVYIIGSQPLPSPSPSLSVGASRGKVGTSPTSPVHAQFEQLALRMSKLVVHDNDQPESTSVPSGSVGEKTSATSSCAASAIFSVTTSVADGSDTDEESEKRVVTRVEGPSMLSRTAPADPDALPTLALESAKEQEDQVSVKIADLGNAARIGKHVTDDIQTRQYRSPEVILRKPWGPAVDLFSLGCVVFELLTGDFLFEPKAREPLWSRDDDHICQMHEALGPFTHAAAQGGVYSKAIFRSDDTLRNVPARKINMWPLDAVLRDKYEFTAQATDELTSFLRPILALDPAERASAQEAVQHPWLWS